MIPESMFNIPDSLLTRVDSTSEEYEYYYELVQLLRQLLVWEGDYRPTAEQALNSAFFKVGDPSLNPFPSAASAVLVQSQPVVNTERSCESLSACMQQESVPARVLHCSPINTQLSVSPIRPKTSYAVMKPHRISPIEVSPPTYEHRISRSMVSTRTVSPYVNHKHRRIQTTPLSVKDTFLIHTPIQISEGSSISDVFSPDLVHSTTQSIPMEAAKTSHPAITHLFSPQPFQMQFQHTLSAEDYRTPTPSTLALLREGQLPQPPVFQEKEVDVSPKPPLISHPPSFDEIGSTRCDQFMKQIASPMQIPLPSLFSEQSKFLSTPFSEPCVTPDLNPSCSSVTRSKQIAVKK